MPFDLANDDVIELTMSGKYQGSTIINSFHYKWAGGFLANPLGSDEVQNLLQQFETRVWEAVVGGIRSRLTNEFRLDRLLAQIVWPVRKHYLEWNVANPLGSAVPPGVPSDTNITISLRTERVGRGRTGNKKITGMPLATFDGAQFTSGERIAWTVATARLLDTQPDLAGIQNWIPIVWSRRRAADRARVIGATVRPEIRVLRRREQGKGV